MCIRDSISAEQLHKAVVLKHLDRLQRPVVSREVEIAVNIAPVLPVGREAAHPFIDSAFLDPETRVRPQLQVKWIISAGDFVRPISERDLDHVQRDIRTGLHVKPKIMKGFPSTLPAVRVRIHRNDVQFLSLGPRHALAMNIRMLEDHSHSPRSCAAGQFPKHSRVSA